MVVDYLYIQSNRVDGGIIGSKTTLATWMCVAFFTKMFYFRFYFFFGKVAVVPVSESPLLGGHKWVNTSPVTEWVRGAQQHGAICRLAPTEIESIADLPNLSDTFGASKEAKTCENVLSKWSNDKWTTLRKKGPSMRWVLWSDAKIFPQSEVMTVDDLLLQLFWWY